MIRLFQPLYFYLATCREKELVQQLEFMRAEMRMLRKRISQKRIFLEPDEKKELLKLAEPIGSGLKHVISIVSYGALLGAGFSLLTRVAKLRIDPAAGRWSHYGEVVFRLTIGGLAALILLYGIEAEVFAGFLKVSCEGGLIDAELYIRSAWIIGIFSIAAGASERLVPSLLEQLSDRTISDSGKTHEDKTTPGK